MPGHLPALREKCHGLLQAGAAGGPVALAERQVAEAEE